MPAHRRSGARHQPARGHGLSGRRRAQGARRPVRLRHRLRRECRPVPSRLRDAVHCEKPIDPARLAKALFGPAVVG
ncbi:Hypothetical protein MexAM1_META1p1939 [Methylorubrum extorquens AM1]|uniref:Uncharacterized protein n=1 Tax=Methylorubrum extorquens (strain ATCC 14718 / DSM 1338 / JCM 2805 / NCIMB 9133 / AM1) TaxID=272630 RepID=C5B1W6_METEA|nr:Hypothetical protein MexAM1_META1p1939 [Methylorubrum extorquens AM1]